MSSNMQKKTRIPKPLPTTSEHKKQPKPLAKVMEKKNNQTVQPQSWYEECKESVSQRQQHHASTEKERRKEELFAQLKKTEGELVAMQDLLDEREKIIADAAKEQEESSEDKLQTETDEGQADTEKNGVEDQPPKVEKFTKKSLRSMRDRMQDMRGKLHTMNRETDDYLADIENTLHYLDSLQTASDRLGPMSADVRRVFGDNVDDDQIIAELYKENKHLASDANTATDGKRKKEDGEEDGGSSEEEGEDSPIERGVAPRDSKFFLTEKSAAGQTVAAPVEKEGDLE